MINVVAIQRAHSLPEVELFMAKNHTESCLDLQPKLAAYALGELPAGADLLAHLESCPSCRHDLQTYAQAARVLPYAAPDVAPPPELRARILAAAGAAQPAAQRQAPVRSVPRPVRRWEAPWLAFGFAFALLLALLGWNFSLQSQLKTQSAQIAASRENWQTMTKLLNSPDVRAVALSGTTASGRFWIVPGGNVACLVAENLPDPGPGKIYQIWLMDGQTPVSVGTLVPQANSAWTLLRTAQPVTNYAAVGVTIEPRGGSPAPTGPNVLNASLSSVQTSQEVPAWLPMMATEPY